MQKGNKPSQRPKKALDRFSEKRERGRPPKIQPSWVIGRADNHRYQLKEIWPKLGGPLLAAETEEQVIAAFESYGQPYVSEFVPRLASDILALIHGSDFPKRPEAQINFLADSLGGRPNVEFRRSRDICGRERTKQRARQKHEIVRKEFYIECSCGFEGPTYKGKCPMRDPERAKIEAEKMFFGARYF